MDYKKRSIDPEKTETRDFHQFLLGAVAPRPIAFVSTKDENGQVNLAPYSFFNVFSSNPPIAVFSSNRRVSNNTTKDTLHHILATKEAVINVVDYNIVKQMTISSVEFPSEVSEFVKSGLTEEKAEVVDVPMVLESPASMECTVEQVITLGDHGGAGHLIICKIHRLHIREEVIDDQGRIDPHKIDLMGRMGRAFYVRASGNNVFPIFQPVTKICLGFDRLPNSIASSIILTGNEIAALAGQFEIPTSSQIEKVKKQFPFDSLAKQHHQIRELIADNQLEDALALAFVDA